MTAPASPARVTPAAGARAEARRFPPMLVPAGASWVGAVACTAATESASLVGGTALLLAVVGVVLVLVLRRADPSGTRRARLCGLILLGSCCAASIGVVAASVAVHAGERRPAALISLGGAQLDLELVVTADGVPAGSAVDPSTVRFSAELVSVSQPGAGRLSDLAVPVMVFAPTEDGRLPRIGEHWRLDAKLHWTESGDARAALVFASDVARRTSGPPHTVSWSSGLRSGLVGLAGSLPGAGGELLPGLAIGDVSGLSDAVQTSMQLSSLSHLTAVSGANCMVIVWLVSAAAARLGAGRRLRIVLALFALAAFVVLVTPQPSVQRAAFMAAIVLVLGGFGRPMRGLAVLSLASLGLLVADPWLGGQYGFGLSVLATAGLLLLSGPLTQVLARWVPRRLAAVIAVPTAAQLACQPMLVLLDPTLPLGGVPANLLADPAATPATLLGLLACLLVPVSVPLATMLAWLGWLPATWIGAVAHWFAALPAARVPWPEGAVGAVLLSAPTAAVVVLLLFRASLPRAATRSIGVALLLLAVVLGGVSLGAGLGPVLQRPAEWAVAACDVGQGDAVLLRSGGAVALVDVGPDPEPLRRCLDELGIGRIELLILTHYDLDHVGGLAAVVGMADRVLVGPVDDPQDERIAAELRDAGAEVSSAAAGDTGTLGSGGGAGTWRVLWPDPAAGAVEPGNDASIAMRFDLPQASVVLLGDLGEESQDRLLARHGLGAPVDIVKVAHHGSADQSARLAARLDARIALISVGADNDYGHPTRSALELYAGDGAVLERTDQLGTILVTPDGSGAFRIWSERAAIEPADVGGTSDVGARR